MPRRPANLLWRATQGIGTQWELQTLTTEDEAGKAHWVTVAHGSSECMRAIARQLSDSRYKLLPLQLKPIDIIQHTEVTRRVGDRKPPRRIEDRSYGLRSGQVART